MGDLLLTIRRSLTAQPIDRNAPWQRTIDVVLVMGFIISMLGSIWIETSAIPKIGLGLTVVIMSLIVRPDREFFTSAFFNCWRTTGGWRHALKITSVMGMMLVGVCLAMGTCQGNSVSSIFDKSAVHWLIVKTPTVVLQQWMMQILLLPFLLRLFANRLQAVVVAAAIFSMMHLPNPILMLLTLIAGVFWTYSFLKNRQLVPVIVSHFLLAVFAAGLCGEYILNMRVGPSCVAMIPEKIHLAVPDPQLNPYFLPRATVGCVKEMKQQGQVVTLTGWALDTNYDVALPSIISNPMVNCCQSSCSALNPLTSPTMRMRMLRVLSARRALNSACKWMPRN
ncbi:MAG: CPBP family intramembrane glutamic endopeptidase [Pirellulaceae bacterium]